MGMGMGVNIEVDLEWTWDGCGVDMGSGLGRVEGLEYRGRPRVPEASLVPEGLLGRARG